MDFGAMRLELEAGILHQVAILIKQKPELFERINLRDYASNASLCDLDENRLSENGKAGWITIDDLEADESITYRFYWEDICREIT